MRGYIFIFLTATIFFFSLLEKSFSKENVFTINNVKIEGNVDLNFSREKYLNKAFSDSFKILMNKILLSRDLKKIDNIKLNQVKKLIGSFQITEESYSKDIYKMKIKILYDGDKVKNFLSKKNISFSQPEKISAIFYPVFLINEEIQNLNENYFYKYWNEIQIKNEIINFILPIEDIEDISKIIEMKNNIENLNIDSFIRKYDIENYVFTFMEYKNNKLNLYLKTNFNNNKINKNISYKIEDIKDEKALNYILKDLKLIITDIWKEENLFNLSMPLSIKLKFKHENLKHFGKLRNTLTKISIIDNFILEEFNVNNSFFKIYYYGDPKKLKSELKKFGYKLKNIQGQWQLYLNE